MIYLKATIYLENSFWVGSFERTDQEGFAVCKVIFGPEPTDPEIYEYINQYFHTLQFGEKQPFELQIKRINPKRMQRLVKKEMEELKKTQRPSTTAQDFMRQEMEKNKKERNKRSKIQKEAEQEKQFKLRQAKKKQKHKGR